MLYFNVFITPIIFYFIYKELTIISLILSSAFLLVAIIVSLTLKLGAYLILEESIITVRKITLFKNYNKVFIPSDIDKAE